MTFALFFALRNRRSTVHLLAGISFGNECKELASLRQMQELLQTRIYVLRVAGVMFSYHCGCCSVWPPRIRPPRCNFLVVIKLQQAFVPPRRFHPRLDDSSFPVVKIYSAVEVQHR